MVSVPEQLFSERIETRCSKRFTVLTTKSQPTKRKFNFYVSMYVDTKCDISRFSALVLPISDMSNSTVSIKCSCVFEGQSCLSSEQFLNLSFHTWATTSPFVLEY